MVQFLTWFLILLGITTTTAEVQPRSVNVALETVLAFDSKNQGADFKFIDDIQSFLTKLKRIVDREPFRRNIKSRFNVMKFTEFIKDVMKMLKTYENDDLEDVFSVLDDEIRKFHYKGCKFYELVEDPTLRRYVADKLNSVKERPAIDIRRKMNEVLQALENAKFDITQTFVLDYLDSLYTKDDSVQFKKIVEKLQNYRRKSKRANLNLVKLVRETLRTVIFDKYSSLNPNTRRDFKVKLETLWSSFHKPENYNHKEWSKDIKRGRKNKNVYRYKIKSTPINLKHKFKNELVTIASLDINKTTKKDKIIREKDNKKIGIIDDDHSDEHSNSNDDETTVKTGVNRNDKESATSVESEDNSSDSSSENQSKSNNIQKANPVEDSNGSSNTDESDSHRIDASATKEIKVKSKHFNNTSPIFINLDSAEYLRPEEIKYPSSLPTYSSKSWHHGKNKKNSFATLHPESVTKKRRFEIATTKNNNELRMQTLWEEKFTRKIKKQKNKLRQASNQHIINTDDESNADTKILEHKEQSKHIKSRDKSRHKYENSKSVTVNDSGFKYMTYKNKPKNTKDGIDLKKDEYVKLANDISLNFTVQKNTRDSNNHKIHRHHKHSTYEHNKESRVKSSKIQVQDEGLDILVNQTAPTSKIISQKNHNHKANKIAITRTTDKQLDLNKTNRNIKKVTETGFNYAHKKHSKNTHEEYDSKERIYSSAVLTEESDDNENVSVNSKQDSYSKDQNVSQEYTDKHIKTALDKTRGNSFKKHKNNIKSKSSPKTLTTRKRSFEDEVIIRTKQRYKSLETKKFLSKPNNYKRNIEDKSFETELIAKNLKVANINTKTKSTSDKSIDYEAEEIISQNLYKNPSIKTKDDSGRLSEEGLAIESYERKQFLQSFRKSNDDDNLNISSSKEIVERRFHANQTEITTAPTTTGMDFYSLQNQRYPTLKFWEGTSRTTTFLDVTSNTTQSNLTKAISASTTERLTAKTVTISLFKSATNHLNTLENAIATNNSESSIIDKPLDLPNSEFYSRTKNMTQENKSNANAFNMDDYLNKKIANIAMRQTNRGKPGTNVVPYAYDNFKASDNRHSLNTAPRPAITEIDNVLVTGGNTTFVNEINMSHPISFTTQNKKSIENIGQLLNRYGLSSMPTLPENVWNNNSLSRRNRPKVNESSVNLQQNLIDYKDIENIDKNIISAELENIGNDLTTNRTESKNRQFDDFMTTEMSNRQKFLSSDIDRQISHFENSTFRSALRDLLGNNTEFDNIYI